MIDVQKSDKPMIGGKFYRWIFYIILVIAVIVLKGGTKGCVSEIVVNNSTN